MLLINVIGLLLIGLIVWWFWLYRGPEQASQQNGPVTITVADGVYQPSRIRLPAGQKVRLRFLRKDPSPCASVVVFEQFDISAELPLNQNFDLELKPMPPGHYPFTCQMQMYRGELIVEAAEQG